eukprot:1393480-Amorphochlora_amoeboformis.AAC.1
MIVFLGELKSRGRYISSGIMILTPPPASVALRCLLLVAPLALPIASGHRIDGFDAWKLEHSKA